jgi:glycosyltransferase involved in cell wall biosynthesis
MHILEIPSFFPPCGGLFCLDQAKALSALGHEVRILSNVQLGATLNTKDYFTLPIGRYEHEMDGITVYQSYQRGLPKVIRYNVHRWVNIVCSMYMDYTKKYGKPDILHAHCAKWAGFAAMLLSKRYHIPYVITEHLSKLLFEEEFGPAPSDAWQIPMLRKAYNAASMVVPVSEELVSDIAAYFGNNYRWKSLSNIVDTQFFAYKSRPALSGRSFRFCCLANYWPLKGYDVLFAAIMRLRQQGLNVELHIAGKDTDSAECRSQIAEGMKSYGLLDKEGVRRLLYNCDALVLATRGETQGLVILEALSTGIPAISTEAIPPSVRPSEGCVFVPVDDAEALADAMKRAMSGPQPEGLLLSEHVRQFASPEVVGRQLSELFRSIVPSSSSI